jgi:DNA-binding response OmpR family regulator
MEAFPLPSVLVIQPGIPEALKGRSLAARELTVEACGSVDEAQSRGTQSAFDLLVFVSMSVDEQQAAAIRLQEQRRWRLVPVLYVADERAPGLAVPGTFRPEVDGLVRGPLGAPSVERAMSRLAREGAGSAEPVVAGAVELDPIRGRLRFPHAEVQLTDREATIVGLLLGQANRTVTATEILQRGWGSPADAHHLQILRRHVSNIRRKLEATAARGAVRTVRGTGYRFDVRKAS